MAIKMTTLMLLPKKNHKQGGFALMETLIAFFVLSIGIMGVAALQLKAVRYNQGAYMRSQATIAAYSILDSIRLNGGAEPRAADKTEWDAFLKSVLPEGATGVQVCTAGTGVCTVTIKWTDPSDENEQQLVVSSRL